MRATVRRLSWLMGLLAVVSTLSMAGCAADVPLPEPRDRLDASLLVAVQANKLADVQDLLCRGASPDVMTAQPHDESTALVIAAREGHAEITSALVAAGANVNLRQHATFEGITPLMAAAGTNRPEIVNMLLERGANVSARSGLRGTGPTALRWAITNGHIEPVILLLAYGATIERQDLQIAISKGHVDMTERLLEGGADPRWTFYDGSTGVEEAARSPKEVRAKMVETVRTFMGARQKPIDK